jgi:carboxyl-terminal processing protease
MVVLNGNTASASEFSLPFWDYNRAYYGEPLSKQIQTILPLDKNDNENFLKLTINKFYRITGKSNQALALLQMFIAANRDSLS